MLPGSNQTVGTRSINEDWLNNTHNKKTGSTPDYLKNAHDLSWGEDDAPKKRPSASNDDKPDDDDDILYDNKKEKDPLDKIEPFDYDANKSDSSDDKKDDASKSSGHIQNYYYYTYNNSNNTHSTTNTNSYNRSQDDHSRNKRTKSHDYGGLKEEKQVWELDVPIIETNEFFHENHVDESVESRAGGEGILNGHHFGAVDVLQVVENQLILHIICIALHAINGLEETVSHGNLEVCCSCCGQAFS